MTVANKFRRFGRRFAQPHKWQIARYCAELKARMAVTDPRYRVTRQATQSDYPPAVASAQIASQTRRIVFTDSRGGEGRHD